VTGAGRGIGRAVGIAFANAGAHVAFVARTKAEVEEAAAEAAATGQRAIAIVADVSDAQGIRSIVDRTREELGEVDILVNNAGGNLLGAIDQMPPEEWWHQVEVTLKSAYLLSREVSPGMVRRRWGRIVNVSSRLGKIGAPMATSYCSAKHALIGFTRALAVELAESGVTVNAVCPGHVETKMMSEVFEQRGKFWGISPEAARERMIITNIPQRRLITPDELVHAFLFLVSEGASRITGESMNVSGGAVMH
jgi:3-hydroxybutyrate dehydrogenase